MKRRWRTICHLETEHVGRTRDTRNEKAESDWDARGVADPCDGLDVAVSIRRLRADARKVCRSASDFCAVA